MRGKISVKEFTNLVMDKGISLMKDALLSNKNAIAFRDGIYDLYDLDVMPRAELYLKFYHTFKFVFGNHLDERRLNDPDYMWPYYLDQKTTGSILKHVSKDKQEKYQELQDQLYQLFCKVDKTMHFNDLYELYFTEAHHDLFIISALFLYQERLPKLLNECS